MFAQQKLSENMHFVLNNAYPHILHANEYASHILITADDLYHFLLLDLVVYDVA